MPLAFAASAIAVPTFFAASTLPVALPSTIAFDRLVDAEVIVLPVWPSMICA